MRAALAPLITRYERSVLGAYVRALIEIEVVERALALASKLFVAIIPLTILTGAAVDDQESFGERLTDRFGLTGKAAEATETLFQSPADVRGAISVLGVLVLAYSTMSFAKTLERIYADAWRLPKRAAGQVWRRIIWVAGFALYLTIGTPLRDVLLDLGLTSVRAAGLVALNTVLWLWTPYVLLGGRVPWRRLLPTGVITAVATLLLGVASTIYMPEILETNAERYGLIGVAFGLVTFLTGVGAVLIAAAVLGAVLDRHWTSSHERAAGRTDSGRPLQMIAITVEGPDAGFRLLDRIEGAVEQRVIAIEDAALVYRNENGKLKLHQTRDVSEAEGTLRGGALGVLVGLVAGPLAAGALVGAGIGAVWARARDRGVDDDLMRRLAGVLESRRAAVLVLAQSETIDALAAAVGADEDALEYVLLPPEAEGFLRDEARRVAGTPRSGAEQDDAERGDGQQQP